MRVFVESSHALPVVSAVVAFRVGSTEDPPGKEGLARITARMLRRGAEGYPAEKIEDEIDRLGAELGADAAPSSSTVYGEVITRNLDAFIDLASKFIGTPTFPQDELDKLIREAQAELVEARDSDRTLASRAFRRTLFEGHPYGRRVAGTIPSLSTITRDDVAAFYARAYTRTRDNALVAVSGDVTEEGALRLAERLLLRLPEALTLLDAPAEPAGKRGRHLVFVDKPERTQTQMVVGALGTDPNDDDHMALMVGNTVFGGTFTSRLMNEVRSKRGWSYGASSRAGFDRRRDAFTVWTAPAATDAAKCLALELELLESVKTQGITADELAFVKSYLRRSHAFEVDTPRKRVHQPLEEALYDLPEGYHSKYLERIEAVTLAEVNAALARRIPFEDLVIAVVGTHAEIGDELTKAIPNLDSVTVAPHDLE